MKTICPDTLLGDMDIETFIQIGNYTLTLVDVVHYGEVHYYFQLLSPEGYKRMSFEKDDTYGDVLEIIAADKIEER